MGISAGGGFFGSGGKQNAGNTEAKTSTLSNNQDFENAQGVRSSINPINVDLGKKAKNNTVNVTTTDYDAIQGGLALANSAVETTSNVIGNVVSDAFMAFGSANDSANMLSEMALNTVEGAMQTNSSLAEFAMMEVSEANESVTALASEFGGNLAYLTDSVILGNQNLTETALNNNAFLTEQFGADLAYLSDKNAELARDSIASNNALTSRFSTDMSNAYGQYAASLDGLTDQTQSALVDMAVLQERGLDSALEVAGSISRDDSSEASENMVKYISIGLAVFGVAMVMKR